MAVSEREHFGRNRGEGMVQVEFVGCPADKRIGDYGWAPVEQAFLELWVDGQRYRVTLGTFRDGTAERRGLHIVTGGAVQVEQTSVNAVSVYIPTESAIRELEGGRVWK